MKLSLRTTLWTGLLFVIAAGLLRPAPASAVSNVVISQVYGGGGNAGATHRNDFIEVFNRGTTTVSLAGMSVQYASAAGSTWQFTLLSGSLAAGQYYLVQEALGAGGTTSLPTPDATGAIPMSAVSGKVALVNSTAPLNVACPSAFVLDMVGFGTANCFEGGGATPVLSNPTAAIRNSGGCTDTDANKSDFSVGAPTPRNTASPLNPCGGGGPTNPSASGLSNPNAVVAGGSSLLTATVTASARNASPPISITSAARASRVAARRRVRASLTSCRTASCSASTSRSGSALWGRTCA